MKIALANSDDEVAACFPVMHELRRRLDLSSFLAAVGRMKSQGYRLAFLADPDVRSVTGFRTMEMLITGPVIYVDDLVTAAAHRSRGYGKALLAWLLDEAKRQGCQYLDLDSGLKRIDAHRFYERNGLAKAAFHFSIPANAKMPWTALVQT
ncbi:MAG TPA: GNAT family N-acetyltransferase [Verrucomicrobiae bacterium]|jgi:GNAT superfamily N-acetyltransferase|nr:GNAT family N-acetyltransferase [Verrucomicrobiae bacterium]